MARGVPNLSDEFVSPDALEGAERSVSPWQRAQRALFGAKEQTRQSSAAVDALNTRIKTTSKEVERRQRDIARHRAEILAHTGRPAIDAEMQPKTEALERERASLSALQAEGARATNAATNDRAMFAGLVKSLVKLSVEGTKVRLKDMKIKPGRRDEQLTATIAEKAEVQAAIEATDKAAGPLSELRADLARQVDALAERSDPLRLVGDKWAPSQKPVDGAKHELPGRPVTFDDTLSLVLHLFGDEVRKQLLDRFDAAHRDDDTLRMSEAEKRAKLAALRGELLELEYREAGLRVLLAGDSLEIAFPADLHPLAVLGLEVRT